MGIVEALIALLIAALGGLGGLWVRGNHYRDKAEQERNRADNAAGTIHRREELDASLDDLAEQHRKEIDDEQEHLATDRRDHFE